MLRTAVLALAASGGNWLAGPAMAEPRHWEIDAETSRFDIVYQINGQQRSGVINRFTGSAKFDPDNLENASLDLVIDMDSIDVGDRFGTAIVKTGDWFDVYEHPTSTYRLLELTALGDDMFRARGILSMRGAVAEVEGTLAIDLEAETAETVGRAAFMRSTFGIGVGFTALFVEVGDDVAVEFELVATPVD
ncbi:MAG: YceI family protein [Pseudomonadota bacterium]